MNNDHETEKMKLKPRLPGLLYVLVENAFRLVGYALLIAAGVVLEKNGHIVLFVVLGLLGHVGTVAAEIVSIMGTRWRKRNAEEPT